MKSYTEMKNEILYKYHRSIISWYKIVGEFFEKTDGFSKPYERCYSFHDRHETMIRIAWKDYSWSIEEL